MISAILIGTVLGLGIVFPRLVAGYIAGFTFTFLFIAIALLTALAFG